jgi:hypothetical protein
MSAPYTTPKISQHVPRIGRSPHRGSETTHFINVASISEQQLFCRERKLDRSATCSMFASSLPGLEPQLCMTAVTEVDDCFSGEARSEKDGNEEACITCDFHFCMRQKSSDHEERRCDP